MIPDNGAGTPRFRGYKTIAAAIALLVGGTALVFSQQDEASPNQAAHKSAEPEPAGAREQAASSNGGARWGANYFPNVPLTTHQGERVRFFDDLIEDKVVVINFMYASCTDTCPMGTARLKKVKEMLGDRVGDNIFMYSITVDPDRDTPQALKEYVERFNIGPGWLFLTGKEKDIMLLRRKLGLYINVPGDGQYNHNMSLVLGNQRTGQWIKRSPMDNPYFLARQVGSWLTNWKAPEDVNINNYADAPQMEVPSMGQNLFRSRCMTCHTIGGGDIMEESQHRVGPDLLGVTQKRDRDWLVRWLKNPAAMLAEEDPIAVRLYAQYNEVLMPNLRLNETEANALIEYMAAESRRVKSKLAATERGDNAGPHEGGDHHQHHHH